MKIVHICLLGYNDGWGYQENLLPEYMSKVGHDVVVIAKSNKFSSYLSESEIENIQNKGSEYYINKVHIYRIPVFLSTTSNPFFCKGLSGILRREKPDVIFHHGVNSSSMMICWLYSKFNKKVKLFVDNHADKINESKNVLWNFFFIKLFLKMCVKTINSRVSKFYGVTPGRCEYLTEIYGAKKDKVSLLPIGSDTDTIKSINCTKSELREKFGLSSSSFVIVSGGKMGVDKGIMSLIDAVKKMSLNYPNIKLLLFGRFTDSETENLARQTQEVIVFGWCDRNTTLQLLLASDLACWPIHHTTLIEDAIGASLPIIVRKTSNTSHTVLGNGEFVINGREDELISKISLIIDNYKSYQNKAYDMSSAFSYEKLVKQVEYDIYNS